jgi:hypothetical protein
LTERYPLAQQLSALMPRRSFGRLRPLTPGKVIKVDTRHELSKRLKSVLRLIPRLK